MSFRVELSTYRGPLDLLLYLVRKHEVDILDIPIAEITRQYLEHLDVLEKLHVDDVGEFIEVAGMLLEIKSRLALPRGGEEAEEMEDPRQDLVERLLDYKRYRDAASLLEEQGRQWQDRYSRLASDVPPREVHPAEQPLKQVELWDLVSAFGRIVREHQVVQPSNIVYDDTPIQVYMRHIHGRLAEGQRTTLSELFLSGMHKSAMIGVFLAVLELVRHHSVDAQQDDAHGEIWLSPGDQFSAALDLAAAEDVDIEP